MSKTLTKKPQTHKLHVKRGDTVMVIAGKDKGKTGIVKRVMTDKNKVIVEGLNLIKKAVKPNPYLGQTGGIVTSEAPIPASKVMLYSLKANKPTRIQVTLIKSDARKGKVKRVRVCKHTKEQLDD
jgi:large subunit ribosomal protein L24